MMNFINAFLIGGLICFIGQILMDYFKLLPLHITVMYVVFGSILEAFNIYDNLISFASAGALIPISNFGHSMTHSAIKAATEDGILGLFTGIFDLSSSGISFAVFSAFLVALVFRPKG